MAIDPARVEAVFEAALQQVDAAARTAYLDHACEADSALRARVESLLGAHYATANFLKLPPDNPGTDPAAALNQSVGTTVGRYRLLEQIGEGGFGVVFMAEQTEPVSRKVAVKIIKPGMDSGQVIARFEAERQALALMDHPNIAKVLDAGTTDDGRPYFVMELVKGVSIIRYCDEHRLAPRQRLELFVSVCQAVQHAHQKGIIHRDLKPTNVLVAEYDERPAAMVIDFGVAKAIGRPLTDKTMFTEFGQVIGTIEYMSPEQAKLNQLDIDTRSDIYSLGVLLYELLAGSTPFERQRLHSAAFDEMLRMIREDEFPNPSTRLSSSDSLPSIAANRSLEPRKLTGLMRGELDWIVMKALEKDRNRRYETANGLAHDIERYLHDEPVLARPPSTLYRFGKFARRNKAALLAAGIVSVALIAGTFVSTWQAVRATEAEQLAETALAHEAELRQAAEDERNTANAARAAEAEQRRIAEMKQVEAEANYQKARATVEKYLTLVSESKLLDVPGLQELRRDLLEAAEQFYQDASQERMADPAVLADLAAAQMRLFQIYVTVNQIDDGIAALRSALAIVDQLRRDPRGAELLPKVAGFYTGYRFARGTVNPPHDPLVAATTVYRFEATWTELAEAFPSEPQFLRDLVGIRNLIANAQKNVAMGRKARAAAAKLVQNFPDVPAYREDLAFTCTLLTSYLRNQDDEVLTLHRQAIELAEGLFIEQPDSATSRTFLARALSAFGVDFRWSKPEQAESALRRAVELFDGIVREFPDDGASRELRATTVAEWAWSKQADISTPTAQQWVREAIVDMELFAKQRPDRYMRQMLAVHYHNLADRALHRDNNPAAALKMEQRALELFINLADEYPDRPLYPEHIGWASRNLGEIARRSKKLDEARTHYESAVDVYTKLKDVYPGNFEYYPRLASSLRSLAEQLKALGKSDEAAAAHQKSIDLWETFLAERPQDLQGRLKLAWALTEVADKREYEPGIDLREKILRRALELHGELSKQLPSDPAHLEQTGHLHRRLGWHCRSQGKLDDSGRHFEQAVDIFESLAAAKVSQRNGFYRWFQADTLLHLAYQRGTQNSLDASLRALEICQTLVREFPANVEYQNKMGSSALMHARQLVSAGQLAEAVEASRQYIAFCDQLLRDHPQADFKPQLASAHLTLAYALVMRGDLENAKQALAKGVALSPIEPNTLNTVAWDLAAEKDSIPAVATLAIEIATSATSQAPELANLWNTLGVAQYRGGQWKDALVSLTKSEELGAGNQLALDGFFLAMAHWQLGQQDEARNWYNRSVEWMDKYQPKNEELIRFRNEAEELLDITQPSPAPTDAPPDRAGAKN